MKKAVDEKVDQTEDNMDPTYEASCSSSEPHLLSQGLNDIVCTLNLPKKQAELLGSSLKVWNLLQIETKGCFYRDCLVIFKEFFSLEDSLQFCNDVWSVMAALGAEYKSVMSTEKDFTRTF